MDNSDTYIPHILVVDDDPDMRALLRNCLEDENYRVSEAATGKEVEAYLAKAST